MEYGLLKLIHIGSLILWLGPALGAWLVFKVVEQDDVSPVTAKVNRVFFAMIVLEHIAFVTLLVSGVAMAFQFGGASSWLQQKLYIVGLVIIPLEVVDILLGNWLAAKASKKFYTGLDLTAAEARWLRIYHGPFTKLALLTIPLSVLTVMYLAVSKLPLL